MLGRRLNGSKHQDWGGKHRGGVEEWLSGSCHDYNNFNTLCHVDYIVLSSTEQEVHTHKIYKAP